MPATMARSAAHVACSGFGTSARRYMLARPTVNGTAQTAATSVASHGLLGTSAALRTKKRMKKETTDTSTDKARGKTESVTAAVTEVETVATTSSARTRRGSRTRKRNATKIAHNMRACAICTL